MILDKLTIKSQLIAVVIIPYFVLLLTSWSGLDGMKELQQENSLLANNTNAPMRALAAVASTVPRMRVGIDMMLMQPLPELADSRGVASRLKDLRNEDIPNLKKALKTAADLQVDPQAKTATQQMIDQFADASDNALTPMMDALDQGDVSQARKIYREEYAPVYSKLVKEANQTLDRLSKEAERSYAASEGDYEAARIRMLVLTAIALIISWIMAALTIRRLNSRVKNLQEHIVDASNNLDLTSRVDLKGNDELVSIAHAFNNFISSFNKAIRGVADNSQRLASTAHDVAEHARITRENCTNERDRSTMIATAINEMGSSIEDIANNASEAANIAKQADANTTSGAEQVSEARNAVDALSARLSSVGNEINSLAEKTESIGTILETIRGISDQTNLLALNAAIEAARAGETGRGFAVVADEVRNLASRSGESADEIQKMIAELQQTSRDTVKATEASQLEGATLVEKANLANQVLQDIAGNVSEITNMNVQVATATEQQSMVVNDMSQHVSEISELSTETADIANQLTKSSENLQELSDHLDELVTQFKL